MTILIFVIVISVTISEIFVIEMCMTLTFKPSNLDASLVQKTSSSIHLILPSIIVSINSGDIFDLGGLTGQVSLI